MDLLRFTNSGTEATLMALAAAKAYSQKSKVLVFAGAYHGGAFTFGDGKTNAVNAPHEYVRSHINAWQIILRIAKRPHKQVSEAC